MIMNSWKSIGASECAPPLRMFIIGTGSTLAFGPAEVLKERQAELVGRGVGRGERDAENGVGAELRFVRRAVERRSSVLSTPDLVERVQADQIRCDGFVHVGDGLGHALAAVAVLVAVAQFPRFVFAGAGAAGHRGAADRAAGEMRRRLRSWGCRANRESRGRGFG